VPGEFRFNVVHMDGHVSQRIWKEPFISERFMEHYNGDDWRPYGWPWNDPPPDLGIVEDTPNNWAFDR
jgi:hypothetical protein